jgi:chromosome partitioning protein
VAFATARAKPGSIGKRGVGGWIGLLTRCGMARRRRTIEQKQQTGAGSVLAPDRTPQAEVADLVQALRQDMLEEECRVFIRDHHVGYIDWATYEENRRMVRRNSVSREGDESMAAIRAGQGLLVGLLRCGHCGRKLHVRYWGGRGTNARYLCKGDYDDGGQYSIGFGGSSVDRRVGQELLKVIAPLGVEASLRALEELSANGAAQRAALSRKLEQLVYEAKKAFEQYDAVDARNGGAGKTTLAMHLAVEAGRSGHGPVVCIDADPMSGASGWFNARKLEDGPKFASVGEGGLQPVLSAMEKAGVKLVVVDTPGDATDALPSIIAACDLVMIPVRPSPNDLRAIGETLDMMESIQAQSGSAKPFLFALNQVVANATLTGQASRALSHFGPILETTIGLRTDFISSMTDGRTAVEVKPKSKAAQEISALWLEIEKHLTNGGKKRRGTTTAR